MNTKICTCLLFAFHLSCAQINEESKIFNNFQTTCGRYWFHTEPTPSPIDLNEASITQIVKKPLYFNSQHSAKKKIEWNLEDGGITVVYNYDGSNRPTITGGILKSTYQFDKLFVHWSNNDTEKGSYHTINGKYYPLEIQAFYRRIPNSFEFPEFFSQVFHKEYYNMLIVSQLFQINDNTNNAFIKYILNNKTEASLEKAIPTLDEYATYTGSLVIPPYSEHVKWIISLKLESISKYHLNKLREITTTDDVRPLQPLYGRKVWHVFSRNI